MYVYGVQRPALIDQRIDVDRWDVACLGNHCKGLYSVIPTAKCITACLSSSLLAPLLGVVGPCTLLLLLPHPYYFVYKTVHAFSRGAQQLQPSHFYKPTLAPARSR